MNKKQIVFFIVYSLCILGFVRESIAAPTIVVPKVIEDGVPFFVKVEDTTPVMVSLTWRGKTYSINALRAKGKYSAIAMLALPVDTASGNHLLDLTVNGKKTSYSLASTKRTYRTQNLNVQQSYVVPPQKEMAKINKDIAERKAILATNSPVRMWSETGWSRPAPGVLTSPFGARRVYNGQPRNPHNALDFKAATGEPIVAVAPGKVIFAGNQYFTGNTIYIDHGQGVITGYAHLSAIHVKKGDSIKAKQKIGLAGATGRVTGPHLHFTMYSYGTAIDATHLLLPEGH